MTNRSSDPSVEVKRLSKELGGIEFILNSWKYAKEGSRSVVTRQIEKCESGSVYVDNNLVCGVLLAGFGLLSMLFTDKDHRQKGYAKLCMRFAFKELAKNGLVPALTVESRNISSLTFHEKLGCKIAARVDWINFSKPEF